MPTVGTGSVTTINKDSYGAWQSRTCSGFLQSIPENVSAGDACTFPSGGIYQDNDGTGDCFECIGYSRTEVRTLKQGTTTVYVKVYVSFDEEGGSGVSDKYVYYGSNRTYGTLPTPSRSGYTFQGWWTGDNGTGTQITSSTVVTTTALNQTLYAKWVSSGPTVWTYIGTSGSYNSTTSAQYLQSPFCPSSSTQRSLAAQQMTNFNPSSYTSGHIFRVRVGAGSGFPDTFCSYRYYRAD